MATAGYIYVLVNESFKGLLKIGKTTRNVQDRIKELSSSTGVPTPFILAYKIYTKNCDLAEKQIHTILELQGYRVSKDREFFNAPLNLVIKILNSIIDEKLDNTNSNYKIDSSNTAEKINNNLNKDILGKNLCSEAYEYFHGKNGKLKDVNMAIALYKKAIKIGYIQAYIGLGDAYLYGKQKHQIAQNNYMKAVIAGDFSAYGHLISIYFKTQEIDNLQNAWEKYINNIDIKNNELPEIACKYMYYSSFLFIRTEKHGGFIPYYLEKIYTKLNEIYKAIDIITIDISNMFSNSEKKNLNIDNCAKITNIYASISYMVPFLSINKDDILSLSNFFNNNISFFVWFVSAYLNKCGKTNKKFLLKQEHNQIIKYIINALYIVILLQNKKSDEIIEEILDCREETLSSFVEFIKHNKKLFDKEINSNLKTELQIKIKITTIIEYFYE